MKRMMWKWVMHHGIVTRRQVEKMPEFIDFDDTERAECVGMGFIHYDKTDWAIDAIVIACVVLALAPVCFRAGTPLPLIAGFLVVYHCVRYFRRWSKIREIVISRYRGLRASVQRD